LPIQFHIIDGERKLPVADWFSLQTVVSLTGDVTVLAYSLTEAHGVAWLVLEEGNPGEPGRDVDSEHPERMKPRTPAEVPGVLIGTTDPRSLTVLIEALLELREQLETTHTPESVNRLDSEAAGAIVRYISASTACRTLSRALVNDPDERTCAHKYTVYRCPNPGCEYTHLNEKYEVEVKIPGAAPCSIWLRRASLEEGVWVWDCDTQSERAEAR
jgi:hypothetical protein